MTPVETIQQLYAAFGRGDVPAILAQLAADVEWEHDTFPNPIPWLQPRRGRENVAGFFKVLAEQVEFHSFEPREILVNGKTAVSLIDFEATVRATGKRIVERDEVHIFRFDEQGRVRRFRHRVDTLQHAMALKGD